MNSRRNHRPIPLSNGALTPVGTPRAAGAGDNEIDYKE